MAMLDRYKRPGGFLQLLQLVETSDKKKQEHLLSLIGSEDTIWEEEIKKKILTYDKIMSWPKDTVVELITRIQPITICNALYGEDSAFIDGILDCLQPINKRKYSNMIAECNPSPADKASCKMKVITEVRGLIQQGIIKLEKVSSELVIQEGIEEIIEKRKVDKTNLTQEDIKVENEQVKRKMQLLVSELNQVKIENQILKDKLAQIKKIA